MSRGVTRRTSSRWACWRARFTATVAWGPSPIGNEYRDGEWALDAAPQLESAHAAVDMIPDDAAVSATYNLLPHLTHRAEIYSFPNPWISKNFGIDGEPRRNPKRVQWIVADRGVFDKQSRGAPRRPHRSGTFRVVFDQDGYAVLHRAKG